MPKLLSETIVCEVTGVSRSHDYLEGYGKPATTYTKIMLTHNTGGSEARLRTAAISMPGDLPIGTRFKLTIEQIDEVTSATIHRGALPNVVDHKLVEGGDGGAR